MKTGSDYEKSLSGLAGEIYLLGERVTDPVNHPMLRPSFNALEMTYRKAEDSYRR